MIECKCKDPRDPHKEDPDEIQIRIEDLGVTHWYCQARDH